LHRTKTDITSAVVKAFQPAEEMNASQQHFMQILGFGKEQYCDQDTVDQNSFGQIRNCHAEE